MAKKSAATSKNKILGFIAFVVLFISCVCKILSAFNISIGILTIISDVCLLIVVIWTAYNFAKTCNKTWRIIFYVLAILSIVSLVFYGFNTLK